MDRLVRALFVIFLVVAIANGVNGLESLEAIHVVLLALFSAIVYVNQCDYQTKEGLSTLFLIQLAVLLIFVVVFIQHYAGGFGVHRTGELLILSVLFVAILTLHRDASQTVPATALYLVGYTVLLGIFFRHSLAHVPGSPSATFAVSAGILLGLFLFVVPRFASPSTFRWTIAWVSAIVVLLGLVVFLVGEYTLFGVDVGTEGTTSLPIVDRDVSILRSVYTASSTFGAVAFVGTTAALVEAHRTARSDRWLLAIGSTLLGCINAVGLYFSNSRASMLAAGVAVALYAVTVLGGRRVLPFATVLAGIGVVSTLYGMYVGFLPIDDANRFALWRASLGAIVDEPSMFGAGIVNTADVIAPYYENDVTGPHNSYLSIAIRAGLVGAAAYLLLVVGSVLHGLVRVKTVDVGALVIAIGYTVHQLFEGYSLYQVGPDAVLGALVFGYLIGSLAGYAGPPSRETPLSRSVKRRVERLGFASSRRGRGANADRNRF